MKTLGEIAREAWRNAPGLDEEADNQAVADAVIAAHEARRWKPIESAPELTPVLVGAWLAERDGSRSWFSPSGAYEKRTAMRHGYTHWAPIPEPPKEGE